MISYFLSLLLYVLLCTTMQIRLYVVMKDALQVLIMYLLVVTSFHGVLQNRMWSHVLVLKWLMQLYSCNGSSLFLLSFTYSFLLHLYFYVIIKVLKALHEIQCFIIIQSIQKLINTLFEFKCYIISLNFSMFLQLSNLQISSPNPCLLISFIL